MKITIYTTKDCAFSKQEKEYLKTNSLQYEEKDLEANKDFLTEMMTVSNNFAGTPVTKIEKDDGTISVLKGFTKEEFDTTLGLGTPAPVAAAAPVTPTPVNMPTMDSAPATPPTTEPPVMGQTMPDMPPMTPEPPVAPMTTPSMATPPNPMTSDMTAPPAQPTQDIKTDELNSVLNKLQEQTGQAPVSPPPLADATSAAAGASPTIPDFPGK